MRGMEPTMREDMQDVLMQSRRGSKARRWRRPRRPRDRFHFENAPNPREIEAGPAKEGMGAIYNRHDKIGALFYDDGSHDTPLLRFLESRAGCDWNDIWKEICSRFDRRTHRGRVVRDRIDNYVAQDCIVDANGQLSTLNGRPIHDSWFMFYVDPCTHQLKNQRYTRRRGRRLRFEQKVLVFEGAFFHQHRDLWYQVEMTPWNWSTDPIVDVFLGRLNANIASRIGEEYGDLEDLGRCYCVQKQSIGRRVIRKLEENFPGRVRRLPKVVRLVR